MEIKKIGKGLATGVKVIFTGIISFVLIDDAFDAAQTTINDVTNSTKYIIDKTTPKATTKRSLFGKTEEVNLRKGVYISDGTPVDPKKLKKLREENNYNKK
jgi:hypothetical protein